tara:strand:- start:116 stop:592 length:477 start_codon:yes stop_codon:yes gene_type:complete
MPDPTGANLTDAEVKRIEFADPHFQDFKLADRMQEMRLDHETGETGAAQALSLTADHTLVGPQEEPVGAAQSQISSKFLFVTTDGTARTLTLCSPDKYIGKLSIIHPAGSAGNLVIAAPAGQNPVTITSSGARKGTFYSDGSEWYGKTTEVDVLDLTS